MPEVESRPWVQQWDRGMGIVLKVLMEASF